LKERRDTDFTPLPDGRGRQYTFFLSVTEGSLTSKFPFASPSRLFNLWVERTFQKNTSGKPGIKELPNTKKLVKENF